MVGFERCLQQLHSCLTDQHSHPSDVTRSGRLAEERNSGAKIIHLCVTFPRIAQLACSFQLRSRLTPSIGFLRQTGQERGWHTQHDALGGGDSGQGRGE